MAQRTMIGHSVKNSCLLAAISCSDVYLYLRHDAAWLLLFFRSLINKSIKENPKWKQVRSWLARRCPAFPTVIVQQGKRVPEHPYLWILFLTMLQSQPLRHCPCRQEG